MGNALRAKSQDMRQQHEQQISQLQAAYGELMLELRTQKKLAEWPAERELIRYLQEQFQTAPSKAQEPNQH